MRRGVRLLTVASLAAMLGDAGATSYVRKPTMEDLGRVWIGTVPKGILEFFRLELNKEGAGLLTVQYLPQEPAVAYRVSRTSLSGYDVSFALEPLEKGAEPIYLRGQATPGDLDLEVGGVTGKWKRPVFLEDEATFMARLKAVTDRAQTWRAQHK